MELEDARVAIIGLGLMGGSMALGLQSRCREVVGVDLDPVAVKLARESGITTQDLGAAIADSDVLILATPVNESLNLLERFREDPPSVSLLMDIGSTKRKIIESMDLLPDHVPAVGGHPLCGRERAGFQEADAGLFVESRFVLTPTSRSTPISLVLAEQLVVALEATPMRMKASKHDHLLADASHLPYLLATALMGAVEPTGQEYPELWNMVATGFLSTSRLAASDLTMMADILTTNPDMVQNALSRAQIEIEHLSRLIEEGKSEALRNHLEPLQQRRLSLRDPKGVANGT